MAPGRVAAAYRDVSLSTGKDPVDPVGASEPLWLPAGWLAVVLMLSAAAPSFGATPTASDGWRARGSGSRVVQAHRTHDTGRRFQAVNRVSYEDDIAGPALRVASRPTEYGARSHGAVDRGYRVAQGNDLEEALERPFGVDPNEADAADRMFDDLPADPFDEPQPEMDDADTRSPAGFDDDFDGGFDNEPAPQPESLFDNDPGFDDQPEEIPPADDIADDLAAPLGTRVDRGLQKERAEAVQDCAEGLAELKANRLDSIDLYIGVNGTEGEDYPFACSIDDGSVHAPRCWSEVTYMWKASALCHKPLYFEDVHLERYGHSWGPYLDPVVSGAHFFGRLPVLPYCMGLKTPTECVYTLGHYRPGSCAPYFLDPFPFTWRAALFQAGATVGVAAFLP